MGSLKIGALLRSKVSYFGLSNASRLHIRFKFSFLAQKAPGPVEKNVWGYWISEHIFQM